MTEPLPIDLARFDWEWRNGLRARARDLAVEYIRAHYDGLAPLLLGKTLDELVVMVDAYRMAGNEADRIIADMWILSGCVESVAAVGKVEVPLTGPAAAIAGRGLTEAELVEQEWRRGDRARARAMATEWADAHRAILGPLLSRYTLTDLVHLVDQYRDSGDVADCTAVAAWILGEYEPQVIRGVFDVKGINPWARLRGQA